MSAAGILANQYLNADRKESGQHRRHSVLNGAPAGFGTHNVYYWFNGTQAMHNMADKDWDTWNQTVDKALVKSQSRTGSATGSWDPEKPNKDAWGRLGGRIMQTSLSVLTLEVYYRYLPLYQLDKPQAKQTSDPEKK